MLDFKISMATLILTFILFIGGSQFIVTYLKARQTAQDNKITLAPTEANGK